jgi:CRP/FNR family transcriptional regulator
MTNARGGWTALALATTALVINIWAWSLISYASRMSEQFVERIETLSAQSARQKVAALLKYLADKTGEVQNGKTRLNLPLTSQEIADMCGLTRETASMQLQRLKKEGVVSGRRNLTIDDTKLAKLMAD